MYRSTHTLVQDVDQALEQLFKRLDTNRNGILTLQEIQVTVYRVFVSMRVYVYVCIFIYIYIYIYAHTRSHPLMYAYTCVHIVLVGIDTYIHTYIHTSIGTYIHTSIGT